MKSLISWIFWGGMTDMLQLLYAPLVMNQICFEWHDTYDFVSNEMVFLRILVLCLALWYRTCVKLFLLFWICFVTCWAVFSSLRCYIKSFRSACHSLRCLNWAEVVESYSELWASLVGYYVIVVYAYFICNEMLSMNRNGYTM